MSRKKPPQEMLPAVLPPHDPRGLPPAVASKLGPSYEKARKRYARPGAPRTREGYAHDWRVFEAWCHERDVDAFPAHPEVVASYLSFLADEARNELRDKTGYSPATIDRARAAIAAEHRKSGIPSPCSDDRVRIVVQEIKRELGAAQRRARPLMPEHILAISPWLDDTRNKVRALRDKVILLTGFAAALRRGELVALTRGQVRPQEDGLIFYVARSKTDQAGKGKTVDFRGHDYRKDPDKWAEKLKVEAHLEEWSDRIGSDKALPFVRGVKDGEILDTPVSDKKVTRLVQEATTAIGLDGDEYSAHSLRSGMATYSIFVAKRNPYAVKKHLRHKNVGMLDVYVRDWDPLPGS